MTITGSSGALSHVAAISYTIQDFAIVANPASVTAQAGVSASSTISVNAQNGYTGNVALTDNVSPSTGLSCSLAPTALSLGNSGSSILSCTGTTGTYTVTVTGTSASIPHSSIVTFIVQDFSLTIPSPATITVNAGTTGTSTLSVNPINGFA